MTLDTHCQVAEGQTAAYQLIYYENKSYDIHSIIFTYIIFSLSALIFEHVFLLQNSFWSISWTLSWIMTKVKKKNWGFNIKVFLTIIFHLYVLSMYVHLCLFLMNGTGKSFRKLYNISYLPLVEESESSPIGSCTFAVKRRNLLICWLPDHADASYPSPHHEDLTATSPHFSFSCINTYPKSENFVFSLSKKICTSDPTILCRQLS